MKTAVPVERESVETQVCPSFGRAPYYVLSENKGEYVFLKNTAAESQGGAGIQAAQLLADNGVQSVLTFRCGEKAAAVLRAADIALYKAAEGSVRENLEAFAEGKLPLLSTVHPGHAGSVR